MPTIQQASGLKRTLNDKEFIFWLTLFHNIMPHNDILYDKLQKRKTDSTTMKSNIDSFINIISNIRNKIYKICEGIFMQNFNKRNQIKKEDELKRGAIEVCDVIISQGKERFDFTDLLVASNLFLVENFEKYFKYFPGKYLNQTTNVYPYFYGKKLKTELQIIYSRSEFRNISEAVSLLEFLKSENLIHAFLECVKLLKIIITIL